MQQKSYVRAVSDFIRQLLRTDGQHKGVSAPPTDQSVPSYDSLGERADRLLNSRYHSGVVNVDLRSSRSPGSRLAVAVTGNSNFDNQRFEMSFEFKRFEFCHRLEESALESSVCLADSHMCAKVSLGKLSAGYRLAPKSQKAYAFAETAVERANYNAGAALDLNVKLDEAVLRGQCVYRDKNGWLSGVKVLLNPFDIRSSRANFAVGYRERALELHADIANGRDITGSLYRRWNDRFKSGVHVEWTPIERWLLFGVGCKLTLNKYSTVKTRLNSDSELGVSFTHSLYPWLSVTIALLIDGKNLQTMDENQSPHRIGMSLNFLI